MKGLLVLLTLGCLVISPYKGVICLNDIILSDFQVDNDDERNIDVKSSIESNKFEPFIPTHEWQVVKENQAVPAGLHIRMNFQTGIKEAKILDTNESENQDGNSDSTGPKIIMSEEEKQLNEFKNTDEKLYFTKSHLKQALNEFRDKIGTKEIVDDITWSDDARDAMNEIHKEPVKQKFRTMAEIKEELEHRMGWNIKPDVDVMKGHIKLLTNKSYSTEEKAVVLDALEEYVHQIDNARDLEKIDGMQVIIELLNDSHPILQEKAAKVIGGAAQNNKIAQNDILRHGGLQLLLRMIYPQNTVATRKKGLYALSALVRGNSEAQKQLVKYNGITSVLAIIKDSNAGQLRIKSVMLLFDLIVEQKEVMEKLVTEGKKQVNERSPLMNLLLENDWCHMLIPLLDTTDFDTKEKVLQAIEVSVTPCKNIYQSNRIIMKLKEQANELKSTIGNEEDKEFKSYLESLYKQLQENIIEKLI